MSAPTYQETILRLERFWADYGCVVMQPYHTEVGAGTFNPATFLRCLGPDPWKAAYVEPVLRPTDGRYGENPFRFQHYLQYQVILKPAPENVLDLYWSSLRALGIELERHDPRLVEDDWEQRDEPAARRVRMVDGDRLRAAVEQRIAQGLGRTPRDLHAEREPGHYFFLCSSASFCSR